MNINTKHLIRYVLASLDSNTVERIFKKLPQKSSNMLIKRGGVMWVPPKVLKNLSDKNLDYILLNFPTFIDKKLNVADITSVESLKQAIADSKYTTIRFLGPVLTNIGDDNIRHMFENYDLKLFTNEVEAMLAEHKQNEVAVAPIKKSIAKVKESAEPALINENKLLKAQVKKLNNQINTTKQRAAKELTVKVEKIKEQERTKIDNLNNSFNQQIKRLEEQSAQLEAELKATQAALKEQAKQFEEAKNETQARQALKAEQQKAKAMRRVVLVAEIKTLPTDFTPQATFIKLYNPETDVKELLKLITEFDMQEIWLATEYVTRHTRTMIMNALQDVQITVKRDELPNLLTN